jgi:hypothetical protein
MNPKSDTASGEQAAKSSEKQAGAGIRSGLFFACKKYPLPYPLEYPLAHFPPLYKILRRNKKASNINGFLKLCCTRFYVIL